MVMSRDHNAGRSHNIKTDNSSIERVEQFKYLGTALMIKILFRKKLRADLSQGLLAVIWSFGAEPFVLQCVIQKYKD
jgi:hypothetical protein